MVAPLVTAAWIGGAANLLGGLLGSSGAHSANRANIALQREQRAWEERMSNTEVQRRVADLQAAGLNPMLAIQQGAASTPNVRAAAVENEQAPAAEGMSRAVNSALQAYSMKALDTDIELKSAQARLVRAQAGDQEAITAASADRVRMSNEKLRAEISNLEATFDSIAEGTAKTMTEAEIMRQIYPFQELLMKYQGESERLGLAEKRALSDLYEKAKEVKGAERILPLIRSLISK